jgi:hypothetical protein
MALQECQSLLVSLADSLDDLKVQINNGSERNWTPERLVAITESGDGENEGLLPLANELLGQLQVSLGMTKMSASESWPEIFSNAPEQVPKFPFDGTTCMECYDKESSNPPSFQLCLEFLHLLATTLQQRQLSRRIDNSPPSTSAIAKTTTDYYPLSLLGEDASQQQKELLLEGFAYLKEDYEERRKGMRQRFQVLLKTNFGTDDEEHNMIGNLTTNRSIPDQKLTPSEDMEALVQRFLQPTSQKTAISSRNMAFKASSVEEDPIMDRGGRTEDDSRVVMPAWQEEPPEANVKSIQKGQEPRKEQGGKKLAKTPKQRNNTPKGVPTNQSLRKRKQLKSYK